MSVATRTERLRDELDELEAKRDELVVKKKEHEEYLTQLEEGTEFQKRKDVKDSLAEIETDLARVNRDLNTKKREFESSRRHELEEEELKSKYEEAVGEINKLKQERDNYMEEVSELREIKEQSEELLATLSRTGLLRIADEVDEDKNIYGSTTANLWGDELKKIWREVTKLRRTL